MIQAHERAAGNRLPRFVQPAVGVVGVARHRHIEGRAPVVLACDLARDLPVGVEGETAAVEMVPEQAQGLLEEGQHAGLAGGVGDELLHEGLVHRHAGVFGGLLDGGAQRLAAQRHDLEPAAFDLGPQVAGHQLGVEVGAYGQDHPQPRDVVELAQHLPQRRAVRPPGPA